jgi:hypothetical protein
MHLVGAPCDASLSREIERLRLQPQVKLQPRVSHHEAMAATSHGAVLLVLQTNPLHDRSIPTKVYEYLRTDRAILGVVRPHSDTAHLLQSFAGVTVVSPTDVEAIANALATLYRTWTNGKTVGFSRNVSHYSRGHLTADLAKMLDDVISNGPAIA